MPLQISERGRKMPASPIRKLMPLADEAKRRGVKVYHLNIGQPDLETPPAMRAKLAQAPSVFAYTPSAGTAECLATLREYYRRLGVELEPDQIIATTGGSEAILFALMACAGEGDEALVVEPFYTNYTAFATMAGVRLVPLRARGEDGFHLPPVEEWRKALSPAHAPRPPVQPRATPRARSTGRRSSRRSRPSAASTASSWCPTRSTASSSTTVARRPAC